MKKRKYDYLKIYEWIKEHPDGVFKVEILEFIGINKGSVHFILDAIEHSGKLLSEGPGGKIFAFE